MASDQSARVFVGSFILFFIFFLTRNTIISGGDGSLRSRPSIPDQFYSRAVDPRERTRKLTARVQQLLAQNQIVGTNLRDVHDGKRAVEEIIHSSGIRNFQQKNNNDTSLGSSTIGAAGATSRQRMSSAPMTLNEVLVFLTSFLTKLNSSNIKNKRATFHGIWSAYHDLVVKELYPWDQEYLSRMPPRRQDGSIYLSIVSFRDEACPDTLKQAFTGAMYPEKLFVGLVQQNMFEGAKPDPDCYVLFCSSEVGNKLCNSGNVRLLQMKDSETLGPYMARYFASKLWQGEEWYVQTDSHMKFQQHWDESLIQMLKNAPSQKPVISHFPPPQDGDLANLPVSRICGPVFATSDLEGQIIRFEGSNNYDEVKLDTPRFAPFVSAGYLAAHSDMLRDVPFDPFLPYIFIGEEILLSARLWTSGYDIFSPTDNLVGHHYERNASPKFWDSLHRVFTAGVHNPLQLLVLKRIKTQLGYPEAARDMVKPKSLFTGK
jgi:hypothetical protein